MRAFVIAATLSTLGLTSCKSEFADDSWLVTAPRVLAVKSEPAEAKPGTSHTFSALLASPRTASTVLNPSWSFCTTPKENNAVSSACLDSTALVSVGTGLTVTATTLANGCSLFGPNMPPGGYRPQDPDASGGYFQPLRVDVTGADPVFHLERITCNLADASADIATQFGKTYVANSNPHLDHLLASVEGQTVSMDSVKPGATLTLEAVWLKADIETYTYFARASQSLVKKRESMRVSWFVNGGRLALGTTEPDTTTSTKNTWTLPEETGQFNLWVVLRDSRGGTDFAAYNLTVGP